MKKDISQAPNFSKSSHKDWKLPYQETGFHRKILLNNAHHQRTSKCECLPPLVLVLLRWDQRSQRAKYSVKNGADMAPWISLTQVRSVKASRTVLLFLFLLGTNTKTWGARSIYLSVQNNRVFRQKDAWTHLWTGTWNLVQGWVESIFLQPTISTEEPSQGFGD